MYYHDAVCILALYMMMLYCLVKYIMSSSADVRCCPIRCQKMAFIIFFKLLSAKCTIYGTIFCTYAYIQAAALCLFFSLVPF